MPHIRWWKFSTCYACSCSEVRTQDNHGKTFRRGIVCLRLTQKSSPYRLVYIWMLEIRALNHVPFINLSVATSWDPKTCYICVVKNERLTLIVDNSNQSQFLLLVSPLIINWNLSANKPVLKFTVNLTVWQIDEPWWTVLPCFVSYKLKMVHCFV